MPFWLFPTFPSRATGLVVPFKLLVATVTPDVTQKYRKPLKLSSLLCVLAV